MQRNIRKNGGSLYIALPSDLAKDMKLKEGDTVDFKTKGNKIILEKVKGDK